MARKTNEQYWREREEAHIISGLKADKELRLAERKRFSILQRDIEKEINDFYARYAKTEGISIVEARKRASAIDMAAYEAKAKKYVKNRTFSKQANQEMRLYNMTMKVNRLELLKSNIGLRLVDAYQDIEIDYGDILSSAARNEFERLSGILGEAVHANEAHVKDIVNASFHNASFSDRIWRDQNLLKAELDILLTRGIVQGKHPSVLARDLIGIIDVSRMSAERLLVTELARVQTAAQKQSFEDCGYEKYAYIAEPTACPVCKALDNGKGYPVKLMMPGKNAPPMHCWCKCGTAAYADREALEARLAEIEAQEEKAKSIRGKAEQMEPGVTKLLRDIEKATGTKLRGLENRLKGEDRILEKLAKEPDKTIRDALRYTFELSKDNYVDEYLKIVEMLGKKGYTLSEVKNYWTDKNNPYNGINSNVFTDGKYEFEIQYHTKESLEVKEKMHKLYENARNLDRESEEFLQIQDKMFELSDQIKSPRGVEDL